MNPMASLCPPRLLFQHSVYGQKLEVGREAFGERHSMDKNIGENRLSQVLPLDFPPLAPPYTHTLFFSLN